MRHVVGVFIRQQPEQFQVARSRWLTAAGGAVLLHVAVLAGLLLMPSSAPVDDDVPTEQTIAYIDAPRLPEAPPASASVPEQPPSEAAAPQPPLPAEPEPSPSTPPEEIPPPPPDPAAPAVPETAPPPVPTPPPPAPSQPAPPHSAAPRPAASRSMAPPTRAVAPPATRAPPGPTAANAQPPAQAASPDVLGDYRNSLAAHLRPYQRYPTLARTRHEEGLVVVHVTIQRDGEISALSVEHGSGSASLDHEAMATLKRAQPLPPVPASIRGTTMELLFPLRFHLE